MKILITTMQSGEDAKEIISTHFLSDETENIKHELIELDKMPEKEGYTQELVYDKESKGYKLHYVEIPKTEEELTLEALKEQVRKGLNLSNMTDEELQKKIYLFDKFRQDEEYVVGDLVKHLGKLYRCKKKHKSSHESLPQLGDEFWEEINPKGKKVEKPKEVPFYSNDITYNQGDLVMYYGKVYESLERQSGKNPESSPKTWKLKQQTNDK